MCILQKLSRFLLIILLFNLSGCSSDEENDPIEYEYIIFSEFISSSSGDLTRSLAKLNGLVESNELFDHDFQTHRIEYKTEFLGEEIVASGLLSIPNFGPHPFISLQHGTIAADAAAPSNNPEDNFVFSAIAAAGYITLVPDFIGFGSSVDEVHPYYYEEHIATPIVDMVRAAKEYLDVMGITYKDELFLAGYSEGGYATMVTHKLIESEFSNEFNLIASAPASGGYDIKHFQEYFFTLETYPQPYCMAFVGLAYETVLGTDLISEIFNEPYASNIPSLFDGSNSSSVINAALTTNVSEFLTADFLNDFETDPKFSAIKSAFIANSPVDWIPQAPMYMYHGTADITVPFENSVVTFDKLIAAGASPSTLTFISLEGKTHATGAVPYFDDFLVKFDALK